jgi:putative ABC transport system permease protein
MRPEHWLYTIPLRLRSLFRRKRVEQELDEEMRFHLEQKTAQHIGRGMSPTDARYAALRDMDGIEQRKEECRDTRRTRYIEDLIQDWGYALRVFERSPGFTLVAILTLALGIGANTAVFTVVNGVLLRSMPFPEPDRLFLVSFLPLHSPFLSGPSLADRHYLQFRSEDRLFEKIATFSSRGATLTGSGEPIQLRVGAVTTDFFAVLRVSAAVGRVFAADEDQTGHDHVVVLSDTLWRSRFDADRKLVEKSIKLDSVEYTVIGVMPAGFRFPNDADVWTPFAIRSNPHNSMMSPVIGRLRPGASRQQAQAELETLAAHFWQTPGEGPGTRRARIVPLKELLVADARRSILIFAGAVGFVLLIACANVANLLLVRAAGRRQEMAVRAALGAGRGRLIRQVLTESTMISLAGGFTGVLLALWIVPALLALAPQGSLPRAEMIRVDGWVLGFTLGISMLTGIVFGLAPALRITRRELHDALSAAGRSITLGHEGLRGALVISEIALALVLLTGAGLMVKSFLRLRAVHPGFEPASVITLTVDLPDSVYRTPQQMQGFHTRMLSRLANLPGIQSTGGVNWRPLGGMLIVGDFVLDDGRRLPDGYMVDKLCVSSGYFRALGIRLLQGRDFEESDNASAPGVVIVSESVARSVWPNESPLGKRISMEEHSKPGDWLTIVGVVNDVKQQGLATKPDGATYQPYLQVGHPFFLTRMTYFARTTSDPSRVAPAIRAVLQQVDRDQPAQSIASMQELIAQTTAEPRFQARLLGAFGALALLLAAIGVYGVLAYNVAQRTHEIGIRMALGAQAADILGLVIRRTLYLVGLGILIGTAGALAVTRVLAKFLFEVKPSDPATLVMVALLLVLAGLAAGWVPARRATKVDPLVALRYE